VEIQESNENTSLEEAKTEAETQVEYDHKIIEYVMVIGFHHHIGGQVMLFLIYL
jgi:hypothetical protein